jgi:MoCo/4Fe-4S cofactor protein with predicted Tat translocation signal
MSKSPTELSLWERALAREAGKSYWRSLRERFDVPESAEAAHDEFTADALTPPALGRRDLMRLTGASVVMAGLAGCTRNPRDRILPFSRQPLSTKPGVPVDYATSLVLDGFALGVLARSNDGRPTKIDGNPEHPASLGATRPLDQASVLDLYEPTRLRGPEAAGIPRRWEHALQAAQDQNLRGAPAWFVLYPQSSPTLAYWCDRVRESLPGARFSFHSPLDRSAVTQASLAVFGRRLDTQYDFTRARVVVDLASDFLAGQPMSLRWARDFASRRRATEPGEEMNRLYTVETMPSPTGSIADHRLAVVPSEMPQLLACLLGEVLTAGHQLHAPQLLGQLPTAGSSPHATWLRALARDLLAAAGDSAIVIGEQESADSQVLALLLNVALGNVGRSVTFTDSVLVAERAGESLADLVTAIRAKQVGTVTILEANPVYSAPAELELGRWLKTLPHSFHLTHAANETSSACEWRLPLTHYLEGWGDALSYDGTVSFIQPLIEPLYSSCTALEVLAALATGAKSTAYQLLQSYWRGQAGANFEHDWEAGLKLGFRRDSARPPVNVGARWDALRGALERALTPPYARTLELNVRPSPALYDGRFASNGWLQELPHPVTKQTWGNAALLGPSTALRLGLESGQLLELTVDARRLKLPALIVPGHAEGAVTVELGYGQRSAQLSDGVGASAGALGKTGAPLALAVTGSHEPLALTQEHFQLDARPIALSASLDEYRKNPDFTAKERRRQLSLLPDWNYRGAQWAMTIDTTICTGCSSCVIACQAENNVPVVGKDAVRRSREMHWLRIDRYLTGKPERPQVVNQPMLCQHCENAPCEYVCPVNATVHSPDGLNEMVYNRCIGTRFCSNNCPYKVRRFNWFKLTASERTQRMSRNPAVTVRERGVMEKCTFCVQRVRSAEINARMEGRSIKPGEVVTACQQACPTQAIQFASLDEPASTMLAWRALPRRYEALHELNTRPRVQYLAKITNPQTELEPG